MPRIRTSSVIVLLLLGVLEGSSNVSGFADEAPRYNYDTLPKTSFSCKDKLPGRYYADPETECQLFHVCVKMNSREINDFKFLCPNGTTFDQELQVCMDYFQVVCHLNLGTNPLGSVYEIFKLSSVQGNSGLDKDKLSFIDPDVAERNTLGDDFQVQEYNNNKGLQQNSLLAGGFQKPNKEHRRPVSDIFYKTTPPTRPTTTRTTTTTTSTTPSPHPSFETTTVKRKPNLETYESYEIESVHSGFQNSFNRLKPTTSKQEEQYYSFEDVDPFYSSSLAPTISTARTTTTTSPRPLIFHNTFRSPLLQISNSGSSSTSTPPPTFQQQATRFNDDFFRKINNASEPPQPSRDHQFFSNNFNIQQQSRNRQPVPHQRQFSTTSTERPAEVVTRFPAQVDRGLSHRVSPSTTQGPVVIKDLGQQERVEFGAKHGRLNAEDIIRPRSFSGVVNTNAVNKVHGPSTVPPSVTPYPSEASTYFRKVTTVKPDKYSIFFSRSSTYVPEYQYTQSPSTAVPYRHPSSTTVTTYRPETSSYPSYPTTQEETTTVASQRKRGQRRRVQKKLSKPGPTQKFDPELKYSRRVVLDTAATHDNKDEIFHAEASIFPGQRAGANIYHEETSAKSEPSTTLAPQTNFKLGQNFGRKLKVNTIRTQSQYLSNKPETDGPSTTTRKSEVVHSTTTTPPQRKIIKRIKVKHTTITPSETTTEYPTEAPTTTTVRPTLRPVKRINVKTKVVKDQSSSSPLPGTISPKSSTFEKLRKYVTTFTTTTTTTPIPSTELVTEVEQSSKKYRAQTTTTSGLSAYDEFTTPIPSAPSSVNSSSTVVVRVTQKSEQKSAIPTPISFKEPILPNLRKHGKIVEEVRSTVREDDGSEGQENATRSPDYDYAYYNTDDDYTDLITSKLEGSKHYGKKPVKKANPTP